jgi:hypothetical protein
MTVPQSHFSLDYMGSITRKNKVEKNRIAYGTKLESNLDFAN